MSIRSRSEKIECPKCGKRTIKIRKKTNHSSRSSYSGGTTIKLLISECEECGFTDLRKELKKKGFNIAR